MTASDSHTYYAWADGVGRAHGHRVKAGSYEEAAVGYTEVWTPPVGGDAEIRIFVAGDDGLERCFTVDLGDGEAEPCD